jgi:signal transduction histidine kinase
MDSYPGALGQVVTNLVNNAVLHGFEGRNQGTVHITGEARDEGWLLLRVADDGCGIPADLLDRIFDPFVTTKMGRGGTGLGLHISYNAVVSLLGGSISVRSTEGEGAVFELLMPSSAPRAS